MQEILQFLMLVYSGLKYSAVQRDKSSFGRLSSQSPNPDRFSGEKEADWCGGARWLQQYRDMGTEVKTSQRRCHSYNVLSLPSIDSFFSSATSGSVFILTQSELCDGASCGGCYNIKIRDEAAL